MAYLLSALLGYLLGSIPFGLVLSKMAGYGDIRKIGSGNIGATNVSLVGHFIVTMGIRAAGYALNALQRNQTVLRFRGSVRPAEDPN